MKTNENDLKGRSQSTDKLLSLDILHLGRPVKDETKPLQQARGEGGHRRGQSPRQGCLVRRDPLLCNSNCTIAQGLLLSPLAAR